MIDTHRDIKIEICQIISSIVPFDPLEREQIDFVLQWIKSGKEIFRIKKPDTPDTHLVSYFAVISPEENKVLLVDHKNAKLWLPPGGHVEPGEHPKDTVKREVKEELGIEADFLLENPLFVTISKTTGAETGVGHTDVSIWYVLKAQSQWKLNYDRKEFNQIRWFSINDIPYQKSDPHMKRFISKLLMSPVFQKKGNLTEFFNKLQRICSIKP